MDSDGVAHAIDQKGIDLRLAIQEEYVKLKALERPVKSILLVHGTADSVIPVQDASEFAAVLGDSCQLEIMPDAGHSFREHTPELCKLINDFLS